MADALSNQFRVLSVGISREFGVSLGGSGLAFLAAIMEPLLHIMVMSLWYYSLKVSPPHGTSPLLFVASGMYPLFVFVHLSLSTRSSVTGTRTRNRFPVETGLDVVLIKAFVKLSVYFLAGIVLFTGIAFFATEEAVPDRADTMFESIACLGLLGLGTGLLNSAIDLFIPIWRYIWGAVARSLIIFSGILFVADFLPLHIREIIAWNPVLHAITTFRMSFYEQYPTLVYYPEYAWFAGLFMMALGLSAHRLFKDRLYG